jgi:hypothetical protein
VKIKKMSDQQMNELTRRLLPKERVRSRVGWGCAWIMIAGLLALLDLAFGQAHAADWTPDQIATLPPSVVKAIQQKCAQQYPADYSVRVLCEDTEYDAFKTLTERGSLKPSGDEPNLGRSRK